MGAFGSAKGARGSYTGRGPGKNESGGWLGGKHRGKPGDGKGTKGNNGQARRGLAAMLSP